MFFFQNSEFRIQNSVVVTGIGLRSCLGSLTESWRRLLAGKSGIQLQQPFPYLRPYPLGLIEATPMSLARLTQETVAEALNDARLAPPLSDCGVVIGSSRGCQAMWEQFASQTQHSLENWLDSLPHQAAILAARQVGTREGVLAPMAACATGIWAIAQAVELIERGQYQRVIVGAVEAPITPLTLTGFQQIGALATKGCYPFDQRRQGLVLAEGAAIFVLESAALAHRRGAPIYGKILGFGLTCDASHLSAPSEDDRSAIGAIQQCLERSQLMASDIDYIHAHGTGTRLNDRREARLIDSLFPHGVAVSSTKGATGHTLGASGAIGVAFSLLGLKYQQLPPCVGLEQPEFALDFVTMARNQAVEQALCFSFGFGGQNAAIALAK